MSMSIQEELQSLTAAHIVFIVVGLCINLFIIYRITIDCKVLFTPVYHYLKSHLSLQISRLLKHASIPKNDDKQKSKTPRRAHKTAIAGA